MNKKGQGIPLNTLIIIILVVIALVVIAMFFLGGTGALSKSIRQIVFGEEETYTYEWECYESHQELRKVFLRDWCYENSESSYGRNYIFYYPDGSYDFSDTIFSSGVGMDGIFCDELKEEEIFTWNETVCDKEVNIRRIVR